MVSRIWWCHGVSSCLGLLLFLSESTTEARCWYLVDSTLASVLHASACFCSPIQAEEENEQDHLKPCRLHFSLHSRLFCIIFRKVISDSQKHRAVVDLVILQWSRKRTRRNAAAFTVLPTIQWPSVRDKLHRSKHMQKGTDPATWIRTKASRAWWSWKPTRDPRDKMCVFILWWCLQLGSTYIPSSACIHLPSHGLASLVMSR